MPDIVMPQLGESVTEGTITRWFKSVGDTVTEDEPLFEVSTDKVDTEVPSPGSGVLTEIRVEEGDTVDVGTVLAVLGDAGDAPGAAPAEEAPAEEASAEAPAEAPAAAPAAPAPAPAAEVPQPTPPTPAPAAQSAPPAPPADAPSQPAPQPVASDATAGKLLSPLVRKLIDEHGLDPSTISGTGVGGRVTREDVLDAVDARTSGGGAAPGAAPPAAPSAAPAPSSRPAGPTVSPMRPGAGDHVEPPNRIRRMTGDAMVASRATSPHVITAVEVDYSAVERARQPRREEFKSEMGFSLTYLPFITRAVVDALREFPHMNASMGDGEVILHNEVHMSVAVDLNYEGLLAPVVRDAHAKRLRAIAEDISDLASRARSKQLGPDELSGGTFTLSNSGAYGSFFVAPVINQPQVAILSTDGVSRKPVVVRDEFGNESIGIHSVGALTLSWDHRAFDGAYAAAFLSQVRDILETRDWDAEF